MFKSLSPLRHTIWANSTLQIKNIKLEPQHKDSKVDGTHTHQALPSVNVILFADRPTGAL